VLNLRQQLFSYNVEPVGFNKSDCQISLKQQINNSYETLSCLNSILSLINSVTKHSSQRKDPLSRQLWWNSLEGKMAKRCEEK